MKGGMESIHNFDAETSWKIDGWKMEKKMEVKY
jgi:hypothetical protein